jgi:hypothetical protein
VNDFVDRCRAEWRRLGVPDPVADEMAADLRADLEEAAAEGATPEDVLGSGAFDARAFAVAWATERGVVDQRLHGGGRRKLTAGLPAVIACLAVVGIVGAVLVIGASPSGDTTRELVRRPALAPREITVLPPPIATRTVISPDGRSIWVGPAGTIFGVDTGDGSSDVARIVGSVLLAVALAAILLTTLLWWWRGSRRWPSGHAY